MKIKSILNFLLFIFFANVSAQSYSKLNDLWFTEQNGVINHEEYNHFVAEVRRISDKIYFKNLQSSNGGFQNLYSLKIISANDSIQNVFKSPITVVFQKDSKKKLEGISIAYRQDNFSERKILNSIFSIDKEGFNLLIPEKLFRNSASKKNRLLFNVTLVEVKAKDGNAQIILEGTFPEEIKFKRSPTQEINKIFLNYTKNKITMSVPYIDKKEKQQTRILFEENF
ncbi:MAG: hypothetical protein QM564_10730 [Bergeyella sp.]